MRHFHFVTRTPQAASMDLETLLSMFNILDQVNSMMAVLDAKKSAAS